MDEKIKIILLFFEDIDIDSVIELNLFNIRRNLV